MVILVGLMVQWRGMLGDVVSPVDSPRSHIKKELILGVAATQPLKSNFRSFDSTRHDCVDSDAGGGVVVILKGRRWLWLAHFNECLT